LIIQQQKALLIAEQGNVSVPKFHSQFKSMLAAMSSQGGAINLNSGVNSMVAKALFPRFSHRYSHSGSNDDCKSVSKGQYEAPCSSIWLIPPVSAVFSSKSRTTIFKASMTCYQTEFNIQQRDNYAMANRSSDPLHDGTSLYKDAAPDTPSTPPPSSSVMDDNSSISTKKSGKSITKTRSTIVQTNNPSHSHDGMSLYKDAVPDTPSTPPPSSSVMDDNSSISTKKSGKSITKTGSTSVHFTESPPDEQGDTPEFYNDFVFSPK
jgi:hypothetical protein